ncbi:hypothetical protein C0991_012331 [Blastosporella zonata]|nr:hypothetical protein C0991_012331 [Blastosporella zonata]
MLFWTLLRTRFSPSPILLILWIHPSLLVDTRSTSIASSPLYPDAPILRLAGAGDVGLRLANAADGPPAGAGSTSIPSSPGATSAGAPSWDAAARIPAAPYRLAPAALGLASGGSLAPPARSPILTTTTSPPPNPSLASRVLEH